MFKFILPTILIGSAVTCFFILTNPLYKNIVSEREQSASYNEALNNSKSLESERDKLTQKYNAINPENLTKLQKLLPDSVDNIRLILEIEKIASPYGMTIKDVKYDTVKKDTATTTVLENAGVTQEVAGPNEYGIWNMEFSTKGSYNNFLKFVKDLESNLRIVDISSIDFSSVDTNIGTGDKISSTEEYSYSFKIKTYWLKN